MATEVIMPVLGMAQETGRILEWLKAEGDEIAEGEPLIDIETDKAAVTLDSPGSGILVSVAAQAGEDVPVGRVIAFIVAPGEDVPEMPVYEPPPAQSTPAPAPIAKAPVAPAPRPTVPMPYAPQPMPRGGTIVVQPSPLAARIAAENGIDLALVKPAGGRIEKNDVLRYLQGGAAANGANGYRLTPASPKARQIAMQRGVNVAMLPGSGPDGAVLVADVMAAGAGMPMHQPVAAGPAVQAPPPDPSFEETEISSLWRLMAQHTTNSWLSAPHFYLQRDVNASGLIAWREAVKNEGEVKITYTDLLIKQIATALSEHPNVNAVWQNNTIARNPHVNVGMAVGVDDGLIVPVIHDADEMDIHEIAAQRVDLVARAQQRKLRPDDLAGGSFTISNLGMYNIDRFTAILNGPQAAILAVGGIVERVVAVDGKPSVQPILTLTLSCDHRVLDGLRGAQFLATLAGLLETPNDDK